jgi:hypothetical protein
MENVVDKKYNWFEGTLTENTKRDGADFKVDYLLYNRKTSYQHDGDRYTFLFFDIPTYRLDDESHKRVTHYRVAHSFYIKDDLYQNTFNKDNGISAIYDAICDVKSDLIVMYKNKKLAGALSYTIGAKSKTIDIVHIGVVERNVGHGTMLVNEIFKMVKICNYTVKVTSNGYADDFYTHMGMTRIASKPLGVYRIKPEHVKEIIL